MASGPLAAKENEQRLAQCVLVRLDVTDEKHKDWATRYGPNQLPTIVYLSSRGAILHRTEGFVETDDLGKVLDGVLADAKKADAELAKLEAARDQAPGSIEAADAVADFWVKRHNWLEAIPALEAVAHKTGDGALPEARRTQRGIELARAHAMLGHWDDAVREAEGVAKAAAVASDSNALQSAYLIIGFCRESQGKLDDAIKAYERCVSAGPGTNYGRSAARAKERCEQNR